MDMCIGYFQYGVLLCITCNRGVEVGTMVKSIVEVFFRLLHYIVTFLVPVVFGAVAFLDGFVLGFFNAVNNVDILSGNIDTEITKKVC